MSWTNKDNVFTFVSETELVVKITITEMETNTQTLKEQELEKLNEEFLQIKPHTSEQDVAYVVMNCPCSITIAYAYLNGKAKKVALGLRILELYRQRISERKNLSEKAVA